MPRAAHSITAEGRRGGGEEGRRRGGEEERRRGGAGERGGEEKRRSWREELRMPDEHESFLRKTR
eukprot:704453-Rhodomonas_salina.2